LQSGSFTTTGTIIAQTINVQQVTSSVIYSSGSNIFGNLISNTQVFTGSVLITGSLTIAGASSATSYSGTTIYGSTAVCSPVGKFTSCIDAGTGTFSDTVLISKANLLSSLTIKSSCSTTGLQLYLYGLNATLSNQDNGSLVFQTNGTDRLTIASTGAATFACSVTTGNTLTINGDSNSIYQKALTAGSALYWDMRNSADVRRAFIGFGGTADSNFVFNLNENGAMDFATNNTQRMRICSNGFANFSCELTAKTLGTNDLLLNNLNYECANYVDGTRGSWLIQEGACDLFIINQMSCKKYKFNLIEIK
jgi:hypothetical protein